MITVLKMSTWNTFFVFSVSNELETIQIFALVNTSILKREYYRKNIITKRINFCI